MHEVSFADVRATAENGIFLAGLPLPDGSTVSAGKQGGSSIEASGQRLQQQTLHPQKQPAAQQQQRRRYSLGGISLEGVQLRLLRRSGWPGGCQDYRPSSNITCGSGGGEAGEGRGWWLAGQDCSSGSTAAVWVAGAAHVALSDVQVR